MGAVFYRRVDPSNMGYAQLRYYGKWHDLIADTELQTAQTQAEAIKRMAGS